MPRLSNDPIHVQTLRELRVSRATQTGRAAFISAASGLVAVEDRLYVVADDELSLAVFSRRSDEPGELTQLLSGELPLNAKARKLAKPDFEVLLRVPPFGAHAYGALLVMGSGSTANRCRGLLLPFAADGSLGEPSDIELTPLFEVVADHVGHVNIEGGFFAAGHFVLLQRGNKGDGVNALLAFAAADILERLEHTNELAGIAPLIVRRFDLGEVRGVPLGFTDCAPLSDGAFVFSAIAEDTNDAVADGACVGAAIGIVDATGNVSRIHPIHESAKVEGIHAIQADDRIELLLVTDADDATIPARLLTATLALR